MPSDPIQDLKREWRALRTSPSGRRFSDAHARRRESSLAVRLLLPLLGVAFVAVGVLMLVFPGPGIVGVVLGAALASSSFRPLARALDAVDAWTTRQYRRIPEHVRRSRLGKALSVLVLLAGAAAAGLMTLFIGSRLL